MDIGNDFIEENAMSRKLKLQRKQEVAIQQNQTHQRILKVKKSESSLGQVDPKNVKITVPSSKRDKTSMSDLSKHSHETDSIPRKKPKNNT